jgi:hypothetical protein
MAVISVKPWPKDENVLVICKKAIECNLQAEKYLWNWPQDIGKLKSNLRHQNWNSQG